MPFMPYYHRRIEKLFMENIVSKEQIRIARKANLYGYLLENHGNEIQKEGDSIRLCADHSVSIKNGFCGYMDFATDESGNAIDCLTTYFDYGLQEAVISLCEFMGYDTSEIYDGKIPNQTDTIIQKPAAPNIISEAPFILPEPIEGEPKQMFAYLTQTRKIPADIVKWLISEGVIYQEREHNNIVFINPERTFAEIRGTNTYKSFHRVMFSDKEAFWWFKTNGVKSIPQTAYIFEAAIDAVSMYALWKIYDRKTNNACKENKNILFCSIAGVSNQQRIDRIKANMDAAGQETVLAVDNDDAGEQCRRRNPKCGHAIPMYKDWNENLKHLILEGKI